MTIPTEPTVPTVPIVVCGRSGRMARLIAGAIAGAPDLSLTGRLTLRPAPVSAPAPVPGEPGAHSGGAPLVGGLKELAGPPPVVVDFTAREATAALLRQAVETPCPLVIGTSGLGDAERELIAEVGRHTPVVAAANFSLALLAVARFAEDLSRITDDSWDAGVLDIHFAGKLDRPSATARFLAGRWQGARGAGEGREPDVASFRMGNGVSEHRLVAAGTGEHVEVLHRVADRTAFLPGVLRSVRFAARARPGVYTLEDVA
ncbi:dihydrodipicolinate reductase C-terminal domain-containing protein [Streptomyces sp. NPDC000594]|uniref:4-hydroxy-tetrahydrodipicolinate reductase n=1 Tax=Streptomyces sp. NPDC000594 TaxID=3154261 RepID=UPI003321FDD4